MQVGVEEVALGALAGGFVGKVAFGHAYVVGTEQAIARACPRLGDDCDGGDSRRGPARFHTAACEKRRLLLRGDLPAVPKRGIVRLHLQVVGHDVLLRETTDRCPLLLVACGKDALDVAGIERAFGGDAGEYFADDLFHAPIIRQTACQPFRFRSTRLRAGWYTMRGEAWKAAINHAFRKVWDGFGER